MRATRVGQEAPERWLSRECNVNECYAPWNQGWARRKATQAVARWLWLTRDGRKLIVFISMNVVYFTVELLWGLYTARIGLISDAFHLCFGCCVLTVSLHAIAHSRRAPDLVYSYGYGRMEVLAGFTNACFLIFMAFSLMVEALHSVIEAGAGLTSRHFRTSTTAFTAATTASNPTFTTTTTTGPSLSDYIACEALG